MTIRSKVLLLSLTLLSIPYIGYEYVREMESYLRDSLEQQLLNSSRLLSGMLDEKPDLFKRNLSDTLEKESPLFAHPLRTPIWLDGHTNDWNAYLHELNEYNESYVLDSPDKTEPSLSFQHLLGKHKTHLYALFIVHDDKLVYRDPDSLRLDRSDHLQIALQSPEDNTFHRYIVTTMEDGWVNAYHVPLEGSPSTSRQQPEVEFRINGTWQATDFGYVLEIRIPLVMVKSRLAFAIADIDDEEVRNIRTIIGTSGTSKDTVGNVLITSPEIENMISGIGFTDGRRVWVLDKQRRVMAQGGSLHRDLPIGKENQTINVIYSLFLPTASEDFRDDQATASRLDGKEISEALNGNPTARWYPTSDKRAIVVSAAYPVKANNEVIGLVAVQETSNGILSVQAQAIANLLNKTLLVFLIITLVLLIFAIHLSNRLRALRNQAERAIDVNGRVQQTLIGPHGKDEIGDLARGFSNVLERLQQYHAYLESMTGRLSHELRTPIAVVRSSLENLELEALPQDTNVYMDRAREGVDRLNTIITRLSEASRLETALKNFDKEDFDLNELVWSCVSGYRLAYAKQGFQVELLQAPVIVDGAPDLIAQLLDKLISNALDFCLELLIFENVSAVPSLTTIHAWAEVLIVTKSFYGSLHRRRRD
ncbi:MAG: histidine kinase dimerization/phospho-acceptor domain-containing protein [Pseudomonadota bacterium]